MTKKQYEELLKAIKELTKAVNALSWNRVTYVPYTQPYVNPTYPNTGDYTPPQLPKIWCQGTTGPGKVFIGTTNSLPTSQENGK